MDVASIARNSISQQRQSFSSYFDALVVFQNLAEKWNRILANQMGVNDKAQEFVDQWRAVLKKGRDDCRKLINESFTSMEACFIGLGQKRPPEEK